MKKQKLIDYLKKDEKKAPKDYQKLKEQVHLNSSKNAISKIQKDERRHIKILNKISIMEMKKNE